MTTIDRNPAESYRRYFTRYAVGYNRYADGGGNPPKHDRNYNTVLTPEQEAQYQQWLKTMPVNLKSDYDYDLRGAWLAGVKPDEYLHMPDTYKKPWHPTFSDESIYSNPQTQGGHWSGENFTPSQYNKYMQDFKYGNWGANSFGSGGGIHIKKENRGKFSEAAKRAGYSTQAYARHIMANKENYSPTLRKRANFALNASKWNGYGGYLFANGGTPDDPPAIKPVNLFGGMNVPLTKSQGNVMEADKTVAVPVAQSKSVIRYKQAEAKAEQTMQNVADTDAQRQGYANAEDKANQEMIAASLARIEAERGEIKPYDGVITDKDRTPNSGMFAASTPRENRRTMANLVFTAGLLTPGVGQLATPYFFAKGLNNFKEAGKANKPDTHQVRGFINYLKTPEGKLSLLDLSMLPAANRIAKIKKITPAKNIAYTIDINSMMTHDAAKYIKMGDYKLSKLTDAANNGVIDYSTRDILSKLGYNMRAYSAPKEEIAKMAQDELQRRQNLIDDYEYSKGIRIPELDNSDPEFIAAKDRLINFYYSKPYQERLLNNESVENAKKVTDMLYNNIQSVGYEKKRNYSAKYVDTEDGGILYKPSTRGIYKEGRHSIAVTKNAPKSVLTHELSHASERASKMEPYNEFLQDIELKPDYIKKAKLGDIDYISRSTEIRARAINVLRNLWQSGIDINNENEISAIVDKLDNEKVPFSDYNDLKIAFSKDDIKKILNKMVAIIPIVSMVKENKNEKQ